MGNRFSGDTDTFLYFFAGHLRHKKICRTGIELAAGFKYLYTVGLRCRDCDQDLAYDLEAVKAER